MAKQIIAPGKPDELREAFKVFDKDKDGFLSADEFRNIMTKMGEKFSNAEVDEMLKAADTNGDGQIDYMGKIDTKWDGQIDYMGKIGTNGDVQIDYMGKINTNGDGQI